MKLIINTLLASLFLMMNFSAFAVNFTVDKDKDTYELIRDNLTVNEILEFDEDMIEERIGKRLKWKEKKGLLTAKWKIKRYKKQGLTDDEIEAKLARDDFSFSFVGFLLGFFLGLLGVLIAWLILGKGGLRSSLYGLLVWLLVIVIYVITS